MLERDVIKKTLRFAKAKDIPYIRMHFAPGVARGWPDFLFLVPGGRPLFIEFKATGGKPTDLQNGKIAILKAQGYEVEVCASPESAIEALARRLEPTSIPGPRR